MDADAADTFTIESYNPFGAIPCPVSGDLQATCLEWHVGMGARESCCGLPCTAHKSMAGFMLYSMHQHGPHECCL